MQTKINLYVQSDKRDYIKLHNEIFDSDLTYNQLEWKYLRSISKEDSTPRLITARADGELVGSIGEVMIPINFNGTPAIARNPSDVMITESYRGSNLFVKLVNALRERAEMDVVVEFGTGVSETRKVWKVFGKWSYSQVSRDVFVYNPFRLITNSQSFGSQTLRLLSSIINITGKLQTFRRDVQKKIKSTNGYQIESFESSSTSALLEIRHHEFWPWRLSDPTLQGKTYWIGDSSDPIAAIFVVTDDSSSGICKIISTNYSNKPTTASVQKLMNFILLDLKPMWVMYPYEYDLNKGENIGIYFNTWAYILENTSVGQSVKFSLGISSDLMGFIRRPVGYRWFQDELPQGSQTCEPQEWELNDELFH